MTSYKLLKVIFVILLLVTFGEAGYYIYIQTNNRPSNTEKTTKNLPPTSASPIVEPPKEIDPTIVQLWTTETSQDLITTFQDMNAYFASKNRPLLAPQHISKIDDYTLLKMLENQNEDFVLLDMQEKYELQFYNFTNFPNIIYVRFGDIINDQLGDIKKDSKIIVASFTEVRANATADYLISKGYTNVEILKGGLLQWLTDKLPLSTNKPLKNIADVLKYYSNEEIQKISSSVTVLKFETFSTNTVNTLFMDSKTLTAYIKSLSTTKQYIISCSSNYYCYNALIFWDQSKNNINIIGFTGYKPEIINLPL